MTDATMSAADTDAPSIELRFRRRIATMEAARAAARDARCFALHYANEHGIDAAVTLGDAYAQVIERCARLSERHGRQAVERELWLIMTRGGQEEMDPYAPPALALRLAAAIDMRPVSWVWPGRIAAGKLTLIAGAPGAGKSQVALAIAAAVTIGARWPCSDHVAPAGGVVICAAEDNADDTIVPRLVAAGADRDRVCIVAAVHEEGRRRALDLSAHLAVIDDALEARNDVRLIVLDPVTSYMGRIDSHRVTDVRGVLEPLADMAARRGVAILAITHPPKAGGTAAMHRFVGSGAYIAVARSAYLLARDPDSDDEHRRLFLPVKSNLAPLGKGLALRLEQTIVADGIVASRIAWTGEEITRSADDVLRALDAGGEERSAVEEAVELLRAELAEGERPATEVETTARAAGLSPATLRRAREQLGIRPRRDGFGPGARWMWALVERP